jgi:hypothetical protein
MDREGTRKCGPALTLSGKTLFTMRPGMNSGSRLDTREGLGPRRVSYHRQQLFHTGLLTVYSIQHKGYGLGNRARTPMPIGQRRRVARCPLYPEETAFEISL